MAIDTTGGHPAMDYAEHKKTYKRFLWGAGIIIAHVAVLLILMAIFLT